MKLNLLRPDDWHLHLRDGAMLQGVLPNSARGFSRALVMPNLVPPVVTAADAAAYRNRIAAALPAGSDFQPLMTTYLTETTDPADVASAFRDKIAVAVKLYPAGATTNSQSGVRDIAKVMPVLERMADTGMPLCVHGEVTDPQVDIFDREAVFIETVLDPLRRRLPELKVTLEHVTTADGVNYVKSADRNLAATLTAHHLVINRNAIFAAGIRPHYYCLPIAKRERHRLALVEAAVSGDKRFFFGSDSAPHVDAAKEAACGCAGCFTAANALSILAEVFEREERLDRLEAFVAHNGADWYGLPRNAGKITLAKRGKPVEFPVKIETGAGPVTIFDPMIPLHWEVAA